MSELRKLNWGCGLIVAEGWDNADVEDFGQEYVGSTELFADNTFDIIACHCALQITEFHDIEKVLIELHRILKPRGVLRISLPDIVTGFQAYYEGVINWFPNGEENIDERFSAWLTWYSTTRTLLTQTALHRKLLAVEFEDLAAAPYRTSILGPDEIASLDTRQHECYFTEARK